MRRRRSSFRKEKAVMLASSCLVLTALTATGLYVKNSQDKKPEQNRIDFSALEDQAEQTELTQEELDRMGELDYDPGYQEAGSGSVDNPGLNMLGSTAGEQAGADGVLADGSSAGDGQVLADGSLADSGQDAEKSGQALADAELAAANEYEDVADGSEPAAQEEALAANASDAIARTEDGDLANAEEALDPAPVLDFTEGDMLTWPIVGNVLVNYSMDKTVYFATLQQYKYNPAIIIAATAGEGIAAAADGQVTSVYEDPQTGTTVVMNLGDGYELTYGQLTDLTVAEGDVVTTGEIIGKVAEPTMYYSVEGSNVYFKLTKDGQPVNPMNRLS